MAKKNRPKPRYQREIDPLPRAKAVKPIQPLNPAQGELIHHLQHKTLTFALGPAGTGKTFLATVHACELYEARKIDKIIVTRPMVSSEEDMGFLPGEVEDKYSPYFAPVREILEERLGKGHVEALIKNGRIQTAPLAFLRGHTFKNCFVIFDECQNTTHGQMKLFLTRVGDNASVCLCGDLEQTDIDAPSGLEDAHRRLHSLPEVGTVSFTDNDCVRSGFVKKVLSRYK